MDGREDVMKRSASDGNLRQLKRDGSGMADDLRTDFDEPGLQAGQ